MVRTVVEELEKQEGTRAQGTEVEKEESRRELGMAVKGGQEEIAMAIKWIARGRGCANTEGSMSCAHMTSFSCNKGPFGYLEMIILLRSPDLNCYALLHVIYSIFYVLMFCLYLHHSISHYLSLKITFCFPLFLSLSFSSSSPHLGIAASLTSLPLDQSKRAFLGKAASTVRIWTTL